MNSLLILNIANHGHKVSNNIAKINNENDSVMTVYQKINYIYVISEIKNQVTVCERHKTATRLQDWST